MDSLDYKLIGMIIAKFKNIYSVSKTIKLAGL